MLKYSTTELYPNPLLILYFETVSHQVVQAGLEFALQPRNDRL